MLAVLAGFAIAIASATILLTPEYRRRVAEPTQQFVKRLGKKRGA